MNAAGRGQIWLADLGEPRGHEQAGDRPVIVFQADELQHLSTVVIIPLTTNLNRASQATTPVVPQGEGGLTQTSVALCHQVRALDRRRLKRKFGDLSAERMSEIEVALAFVLGMPG